MKWIPGGSPPSPFGRPSIGGSNEDPPSVGHARSDHAWGRDAIPAPRSCSGAGREWRTSPTTRRNTSKPLHTHGARDTAVENRPEARSKLRAPGRRLRFRDYVLQRLCHLQVTLEAGKKIVDQFPQVGVDRPVAHVSQPIDHLLMTIDHCADELAIERRALERTQRFQGLVVRVLRPNGVLPGPGPFSGGRTYGVGPPLEPESILVTLPQAALQGIVVDIASS